MVDTRLLQAECNALRLRGGCNATLMRQDFQKIGNADCRLQMLGKQNLRFRPELAQSFFWQTMARQSGNHFKNICLLHADAFGNRTLRQHHAVIGINLLKRAAGKRLAIDENTVAIEDNEVEGGCVAHKGSDGMHMGNAYFVAPI